MHNGEHSIKKSSMKSSKKSLKKESIKSKKNVNKNLGRFRKVVGKINTMSKVAKKWKKATK